VSYCNRGVAVLGSLAISDKDLKRIETLSHDLRADAWKLKDAAARDAGELLSRADKSAGKVRAALIFNSLVTGISTIALVRMALKKGKA
jgi:hypothetical protein